PRVEGVGILSPVFVISWMFNPDVNLGFGTWSLRFQIPRRYPVSPPDLPADAPILNVLKPFRVNFFPVGGKETDEMIAHDGERFLRFRITEKQLLAQTRLDRHLAAIAKTNVVFVRLGYRK